MNSTKHTGWYTTPIGGPQTRTIHIILESIKFHPNLEEHLEKILNREDLPSAHSIAVSSDYSQRFDPKTQFAMNSVVLALKETHHPPLRKFIFHGLDTRLSINLFSGQIAPYLTMLMLSHVSLDTARSPLLRMGSLLILKISHSVVWNNLADMFSVLGALPLLECLDLQHVRLQELPNEYVVPKPKPNLARLQRLTFVDHSARSATWVRDVLLGLAFPSTVELYIEHDLRNDPVDGVSRQLSWAAPRAVPRLVDFSTLTIHLYKELRDDVKVRLDDGCSIVASSARWTEAAQADGSDPWLPKLFSYSLPPAHMTRLESDSDFFAMSAVQSLAKYFNMFTNLVIGHPAWRNPAFWEICSRLDCFVGVDTIEVHGHAAGSGLVEALLRNLLAKVEYILFPHLRRIVLADMDFKARPADWSTELFDALVLIVRGRVPPPSGRLPFFIESIVFGRMGAVEKKRLQLARSAGPVVNVVVYE